MFKINRKKQLIVVLYLINNFSTLLSNPKPIIINNINNDELILHSPIKFTANGINCFLKHTYNHPQYASTIVPHNTGHFIQLLEHGKDTKQDHDYILAVLRLFRQKVSEADYISAAELERITTFVPTILEEYLDIKHTRHNKAGSRKIKHVIGHLVENCLSKTLWDIQDPELTIKQFIQIGNNLENMLNAKIIADQDDLNDIIHILVDRFIYVINLASGDLPTSFYEDLKKKLDPISWMKIDEIEDLVDTKLQKMERALFRGKIKSEIKSNTNYC